MDNNAFGGLETLFWTLIIGLLVTLPLAIWKLIEIILWIFNHLTISFK